MKQKTRKQHKIEFWVFAVASPEPWWQLSPRVSTCVTLTRESECWLWFRVLVILSYKARWNEGFGGWSICQPTHTSPEANGPSKHVDVLPRRPTQREKNKTQSDKPVSILNWFSGLNHRDVFQLWLHWVCDS